MIIWFKFERNLRRYIQATRYLIREHISLRSRKNLNNQLSVQSICLNVLDIQTLAALVGAYIPLLPFAPLARALLLLSCNFWFRSAISILILPLPRFNFFSLLSVYQPLYYLLSPSLQATYHLFFLYSLGLLSSPSFRCAATASSSSGQNDRASNASSSLVRTTLSLKYSNHGTYRSRALSSGRHAASQRTSTLVPL